MPEEVDRHCWPLTKPRARRSGKHKTTSRLIPLRCQPPFTEFGRLFSLRRKGWFPSFRKRVKSYGVTHFRLTLPPHHRRSFGRISFIVQSPTMSARARVELRRRAINLPPRNSGE